MRKLEDMTAQEIARELGIAVDSLGLDLVLGDNEEAKEEMIKLSERKKSKVIRDITGKEVEIGNVNVTEEYAKILGKYEDSVNKEYLVAYSLFNLKRYSEAKNLSEKDRKTYEASMRKYIQLLGKRNFNMVFWGLQTDKQRYRPIRVINSQELIECVKTGRSIQTLFVPSRKKLSKILDLDETLGLYEIVHILTSNDIKSIVTYGKDVAKYINKLILTECWKIQKEKQQNIDDMTVEDIEDIGKIVSEILISNCKYISVDKLYLMLAYRFIERVETEPDLDAKIYHSLILLLSSYIEKGTTVEIREKEESMDDIYSEEDKILRQYSFNDLTEDMKRFIGDRFIKKSEIEETKKAILEGKETLRSADQMVVSFIKFSQDDLDKLVEASEDNVIFTLEKDYMDHMALSYALSVRGKCSNKLLSMIIEKGFADGQDVLYLYYEGVVSLENIEAILGLSDKEETEKIETLGPDFISKDDINQLIRELYAKIADKEKEPDEKEINGFNRFVKLYKLLNINGKTDEEIGEASFRLISSFEDDYSNEILEELYQYGLIRLKDAADWGINLKKMMLQGDIRPVDLKELYYDGTIRMEEIRNVLIGDSIPYEEKLDLIYSTFDGESQEEYDIRDELIQLLETEEEYKDGKRGPKRIINPDDEENGKNPRPRGREFVSDPHTRWKLISLLDKDYSRKVLPDGMRVSDGHRIFLLPNLDSVIIEKMLEKRGGRQVSSYAAATYILKRNVFDKFAIAIVENGKVIRSLLGDLERHNYATKIIHNRTWGDKLKEHFGISIESGKYTEEEISQIDQAIENVEKSRQERE